MSMKLRTHKGVTLIELLLFVGILAIIASIVMLVVHPTEQLEGVRDSQRRSDLTTIVSAVYQYAVDHGGGFPAGVDSVRKQICAPSVKVCGNNTINLDILAGDYIIKLPHDPLVPQTASGTQYFIMQDSTGHITLDAPQAEQAEVTVTR